MRGLLTHPQSQEKAEWPSITGLAHQGPLKKPGRQHYESAFSPICKYTEAVEQPVLSLA